jgi:hypothetical protein
MAKIVAWLAERWLTAGHGLGGKRRPVRLSAGKRAQEKNFGVDTVRRNRRQLPRDCAMIIERVELQRIRTDEYISILNSLDVGECIFADDFKRAQSLRSLAYYLKKTRNLERNFMFRKMDQGWRLIRVSYCADYAKYDTAERGFWLPEPR